MVKCNGWGYLEIKLDYQRVPSGWNSVNEFMIKEWFKWNQLSFPQLCY